MTMKLIVSLVLGGFLASFAYIYTIFFVKPQRLTSRLRKQGIKGPSPSLLLGNIPEIRRIQLQVQTELSAAKSSQKENHLAIDHDWPSTIFPHFKQWINEYAVTARYYTKRLIILSHCKAGLPLYNLFDSSIILTGAGPSFMYSTGRIQQLCTTDIDMVKEISLCTSSNLGKPSYLSKDRGPLLGQSIFSTNGPIWGHQRKIIAPEFYIDKVKSMVSLMVDCTTTMIRSWESRIGSDGGMADINIDLDMRSLSADIISRACFGSNYTKGEEIFSKLRTLQDVMSRGFIGIPGSSRYIPTKNNWEIWKLEKEINSMILRVVKQRAATNYEKDLLQMILESAKSYGDQESLGSDISIDRFIVDNCKAIYFAGYETTAITASWCLMLLATHQEWQARARVEVLKICKENLPDADMLRNMKTVTMVIQETMRLYPPVAFVTRSALQDIKFKEITIPKGMNIQIPIPIVQQNPGTWGPDAHQFNPKRFAKGILEASSSPQAYMPFGVGARTCAGQHFAMAELKVILSLILSKFSFSLSPAYRHSPEFKLVVQPGNEVTLRIRRVSSHKKTY
ncbi:unnamed protein product [Dovyalis caffra]|uniref:Cytochrome P450 n=1 Tax=Dovyalis caffra TaxID=77055 RepID=A0AAV1SBX3_9ROSI|nr:unnamed protein product [Dovyalis caffra]